MVRLEVCVDDALGLAEAVAGGADRVELCAALPIGGLTPSLGLMELAAKSGVPCYPMIRPGSGDFVFTPADVAVMKADIRAACALGLPGVVLGASLPDGRLDIAVLSDLIAEAHGLDLTLHRAVDLCPDADEAVETAVALGFTRILSSGGAKTAIEGIDRLALMFRTAAGRLIVMPGSGVSLATVPALSRLPLTEVHASCAAALPGGGQALEFGFQSKSDKRTDRAKVAALKAALKSL